jgi:hypothetical protein
MLIKFITSVGVDHNILRLLLMYVSNATRGMLQTTVPDCGTVGKVTAHHLSVKHCFLFSSVCHMLKWLAFGKERCMPYVLDEAS